VEGIFLGPEDPVWRDPSEIDVQQLFGRCAVPFIEGLYDRTVSLNDGVIGSIGRLGR
jgi:hypothetical protein